MHAVSPPQKFLARWMIGELALIVLCVTGATADNGPSETPDDGSEAVLFESTVQKIFQAKCQKCHNDQAQKGEFDVSSPAGILKGSESGPVLDREEPAESLLLEMILEGQMPPEDETPLTKQEMDSIRLWIESGAKFSQSVNPTAAIDQHAVVPIMHLRCTVCHGLRRKEAGLDLRSKAGMLAGGKSGPAIIPGKPEESLVLKRIHAGEMPPRRELVAVSIKTMQPSEIDILTRWIAAGAPEVKTSSADADQGPDPLVSDADRQFWSFQSPRNHELPKVQGTDRVKNFIDAFVLARLEAENLTLAPEADRATLIRRATMDLIGLPPEPNEVRNFLADPDPRAYERLIDRLLESPRYGERWGRHWLDVAGYSDSEGIQNTDKLRPHVFRYRDYVIRAFNDDKPYDRFLLEQIAGDELADYESAEVITQELYDNLAATGFLRLGIDGTFANITNFVPDRLEVIADEIDVLTSGVMGLTLKCARCHSHKFDPLPQRDYYRILAVFKGAYDEHDWLSPERKSGAPGTRDRYLPYVTTAERASWEEHEKSLTSKINAVRAELQKTQQQLIAKHVEKRLAELPEAIQQDVRRMLSTPAKKRTDIQNYLAEKFEKSLTIDAEEVQKLEPDFKQLTERTESKVKSLEKQRTPEPLVRALWDRGEPSPTYLLRRGNYLTPGRPVVPGVPAVLTAGESVLDVQPPWPGSKKSGRRLAFARWLTKPDHPLTARVMVNRVWKHHFGRGIVNSLGNFGRTGSPPTHPKLLDQLAMEFVAKKWSIKSLHRLMMTSAVYRQSSQITPELEKLDPENQLLSRMPLRRMDAEVIRDSLLVIAGKLDTSQYGPPSAVETRPDGLVVSAGGESGYRRSIYVLQRRREVPTILENFDLPQMNPNCLQRSESVVATQALHLMNNGMVHQLSGDFANRVLRDVGADPKGQVERAYLIALSRSPSDEELTAGVEFLDQLTQQWRDESDPSEPQRRALESFCHALINSAAFLYID